jgi:hypothetical protein
VLDERNRYLRQLRRMRRSARRWSMLAGTFAGASAILVPYHGLGWPDAIWAALTGGSAALTWWRWSDLRELHAQPVPEPVGPAERPLLGDARVDALVSRWSAGRGALAELRRMQSRARLRGSSVLPAWNRLDRATQTFAGLAPRLAGQAAGTVPEARAAERTLRDLGERAAAVERALRLAPGGGQAPAGWPSPGGRQDGQLVAAHADLMRHFTQGVEAYERLVAAAAGYVAEDGRTAVDDGSPRRLTEAADLLAGIATALSELRTANGPASV